MGWFVKVRTSLRHHQLLQRKSIDAQLLFRICLEIAGDYEQGDALAMRGPKGPVPMTIAEIAYEAGPKWTIRRCTYAMGELMEIGLIELCQPECYFIPRFTEKTRMSGAERMQALRDKESDESVTPASRSASQSCDESGPVRDSNTPSSGDKSPSSGAPRRSKKTPKEPDTAWVEPLRSSVRTLHSENKKLSELTPDERFLLGRYHAWRWANCTKTEAKNQASARKIARGIADLAVDRRYGELTVKDYIAHGEAIWKAGGEAPWFQPWDVKSRVEFEATS